MVGCDFVGDQNDYDELARDALKLSDWKRIESDIILIFKQCKNEKLERLEKEMSCIKTKLELACKKTAIITIHDLVLLLHEKDSSIVRAFIQSNVQALKNNHLKHLQFMGTFSFVCWLGFSPKKVLDKDTICRIFSPDFINKLLAYEEYANMWKKY